VILLGAHGSGCVSLDCYIGAYFFMDRKCIETIGYYNTEYVRYGYEDITYSRRALAAGLLGIDFGYPFPVWINMYIHSMDMFCENPTPNMTQGDKEKYIKMNTPIFHEEMGRIDNKKELVNSVEQFVEKVNEKTFNNLINSSQIEQIEEDEFLLNKFDSEFIKEKGLSTDLEQLKNVILTTNN
jgi:hypothetical protein